MRPAAKNNPRPVQTLLLSLGSLGSDSFTAGKTVSARCKSPSTRPGDGGFYARHAVSSRRGSHTHTAHTPLVTLDPSPSFPFIFPLSLFHIGLLPSCSLPRASVQLRGLHQNGLKKSTPCRSLHTSRQTTDFLLAPRPPVRLYTRTSPSHLRG
ncbi:hypothetical protein BO86DRAFT_69263 [Aspergillus japonicus CBS 114.51]|uniref:Uncharacterized protein n=1 Tax=Aspergillus japonicus CBS 114.51 TaxID=1448312 RepID=A0A8T8X3H0_ASPJA|nr:hypothetical protein BO86DRAFT_69263 [Aspergillus japonicus CBS 114.51]RAH82494.1 hypothetical protein BO86DRAFT_69263 [Aspergillus japonicus CBS 114.51]